MKKETSCGAVIFKENNDEITFLLIESKEYHHWSFPKGHMEINESMIETALREVFEETNLEIKLVEGFQEKITYNPFPHLIKDVIYFLGKPLNNDVRIQVEEVSNYRWLNYNKALKIITYENEKDILIKAYEYLLNK